MLPGNTNLNIRSWGEGGWVINYNNKILISDSKFVLGKNDKINTLEMTKISHKVVLQPIITDKNLSQEPTNTQTITQKEEKVALILSLVGGICFSERINLRLFNIQTLF